MAHHLTHAGLAAGAPICGRLRGEGDSGTHFAYAPEAWLEAGATREGVVICGACLEVGREVLREMRAAPEVEEVVW